MDVGALFDRLESLDFGVFVLGGDGTVDAGGYTRSCARLLGRAGLEGLGPSEFGVDPTAGGRTEILGRAVELRPVWGDELEDLRGRVWSVRDVQAQVAAESRVVHAEAVLEAIKNALSESGIREFIASGTPQLELPDEEPEVLEALTEAGIEAGRGSVDDAEVTTDEDEDDVLVPCGEPELAATEAPADGREVETRSVVGREAEALGTQSGSEPSGSGDTGSEEREASGGPGEACSAEGPEQIPAEMTPSEVLDEQVGLTEPVRAAATDEAACTPDDSAEGKPGVEVSLATTPLAPERAASGEESSEASVVASAPPAASEGARDAACGAGDAELHATEAHSEEAELRPAPDPTDCIEAIGAAGSEAVPAGAEPEVEAADSSAEASGSEAVDPAQAESEGAGRACAEAGTEAVAAGPQSADADGSDAVEAAGSENAESEAPGSESVESAPASETSGRACADGSTEVVEAGDSSAESEAPEAVGAAESDPEASGGACSEGGTEALDAGPQSTEAPGAEPMQASGPESVESEAPEGASLAGESAQAAGPECAQTAGAEPVEAAGHAEPEASERACAEASGAEPVQIAGPERTHSQAPKSASAEAAGTEPTGGAGPESAEAEAPLLEESASAIGTSVGAEEGDELEPCFGEVVALEAEALPELSPPTWADVLEPVEALVEETAQRLGRSVELKLEGADVPIDLHAAEEVVAALPAVIENALRHGVEPPEERGNKPPQGRLRVVLSESEAGTSIRVEDDGRGIDVDELSRRVVGRGILSAEQVQALRSHERLALAFVDGVGDGNGLAGIRQRLSALGTRLEIRTARGRGTSVTFVVPGRSFDATV